MDTKTKEIMKQIEYHHSSKLTDNDIVFINQIAIHILNDAEFMDKVRNNSRENIEAVFGKYLDQAMIKVFNNNKELINILNNNPDLMSEVKNFIIN